MATLYLSIYLERRQQENEVVVFAVTLWQSKKWPIKENTFLLRSVFLMCGDQAHWCVAVSVNLNFSPEIWLLDSLAHGSATRSRRAQLLWGMLESHWLVHNRHLPLRKPKTIAPRTFCGVYQDNEWSCGLYGCYGAELGISQSSARQELDLLSLTLDLSSQDKEQILISWHMTIRMLGAGLTLPEFNSKPN